MKNSISLKDSCVKEIWQRDIRQIFAESGISIAEWARTEGYSTALVYQVIESKRACVRGQSYRIAVALGLKKGDVCDLKQLKGRLAEFAAKAYGQEKESAM